jgi:hypothetical protein
VIRPPAPELARHGVATSLYQERLTSMGPPGSRRVGSDDSADRAPSTFRPRDRPATTGWDRSQGGASGSMGIPVDPFLDALTS